MRRGTRLRRERKHVLCDRCGGTRLDGELTRQNGYMVCSKCRDAPSYKEDDR